MAANLDLDVFRRIQAQWRDLPPILVAIWFVDRLLDYHTFRRRYGYPEQRDPFALRIYEWYACYAESDEDWRRVPAFCRIPGVWLQMSDRTARPLAPEAIAALLDGTLNPYDPTDLSLQHGQALRDQPDRRGDHPQARQGAGHPDRPAGQAGQ